MMYTGEQALGLIETLGMAPAIYGADSMLKSANVMLAGYENIGSTLVAIMVEGDVAACEAAVEAGALAASSIGKLTAQNVMPRPLLSVSSIVRVHGVKRDKLPAGYRSKALGIIEVFGVVYLLEAADAMLKASNVELAGYENVASGYVSVLVEGDVSACIAAVEAGLSALERKNVPVHCSVVIPSPHPDLIHITKNYKV